MPRPSRSRALAAAAVLAACFLAAACSPAPTPASLSDPREILDAAVAHLRSARTVHLVASVDGTIAFGGLIGGPTASGRGLGLTGTRLEGDLDLAGQAAAIHFQVPALLGLEGEVRQVAGVAYLESSLTSRGWHRLGAADLPAGVGRPLDWLDGLVAWFDRPSILPVRLDDDACPAGRCYVLRLTVYPADIRAMASAAPELATGLAGATLTIELRIDRTSVVLSRADVRVDLGSSGAIDVSGTFTAWDATVTIAAPSPSEIVPGPLLP